MNLPASAPEFLDAFRGWSLAKLPEIHVHCFCVRVAEPTDGQHEYQEAIDRCAEALGSPLTEGDVEIRVVRDVAPNKYMLCVSFQLPDDVRRLKQLELDESSATERSLEKTIGDGTPDAKRLRVE